MTTAPAIAVRAAEHADLNAVAQLAAAVALQPLLQRYGASAAGLQRELQRLIDLRLDPGPSDLRRAGPQESLLLAHTAQPATDPGGETAADLLGLARFYTSGQFGNGGYLRLLALRPGCEGRGVGTLLLRAVEDAVRAHSASLFLLTSDFNHGAQRFYAREGYAPVGALPDFARAGITEQIFWKRLR